MSDAASSRRQPDGRIMSQQKFRLITRSDFDGLVCAALLRELDMIDEILFAHPKDVQDGKVEMSRRDITCNLPFQPGVHLCFDHHVSEFYRNEDHNNHILDPHADSAARVVYEYYGGRRRFPKISEELLIAVDKADSARFSEEEILDPSGWELINFIMDSRTGLGRFRSFTISNYQLMLTLVDAVREASSPEEILALPDVQERVALYEEHVEPYINQLHECAEKYENLVVLDLRDEEVLYAGNRFMIYALYPECDISMHVMWGKQRMNTVFAVGKSIINRDNPTNIGHLMLQYGGGGHEAAGTCQIDNDKAEKVLVELVDKLTAGA